MLSNCIQSFIVLEVADRKKSSLKVPGKIEKKSREGEFQLIGNAAILAARIFIVRSWNLQRTQHTTQSRILLALLERCANGISGITNVVKVFLVCQSRKAANSNSNDHCSCGF